MENTGKKTIYTTIDEIIEPSRTALVVWDVQQSLIDIIFNKEDFIRNITGLLNIARSMKIPIFHTKIDMLPLKYESAARIYTYNKLLENTQDSVQFPKEQNLSLVLNIEQDEIVISKHTASIFIGTYFEHMMRNAGINTIIFAGIATELGIESSARDALNRGFYPVIVSNAVSSSDKDSHSRSLENMRRFFNVVDVDEINSIWSH